MEKLRDHRTKGAARHNDRAFRTKWPAGTDGNCGRERLEKCNFGFDTAAIDQNRFDSFRNAVAADPLRTIASHHADDESAANRYENTVVTQMVASRRNHGRVPAAKIKEVGKESDQTEQH